MFQFTGLSSCGILCVRPSGFLLTELWLTKSRGVLWFLPREHDLHSIRTVFAVGVGNTGQLRCAPNSHASSACSSLVPTWNASWALLWTHPVTCFRTQHAALSLGLLFSYRLPVSDNVFQNSEWNKICSPVLLKAGLRQEYLEAHWALKAIFLETDNRTS